MATLLDAAGPASIRTLGDPEQAQPVGPGGWQPLVDQAIGGHAQLTRVVRQHDPADREACQAIREGRAPQALASLHARGRLHLAPDWSAAVKEVVHAWDRHRLARGLGGVAVVTDTDNATVDTLNALCQARRQANGELTGPAVTVVDRAHSRCERLFAGDRVRFVRPYVANDDHFPTYGLAVLGERPLALGDGGQVTAVNPDRGLVVVEVDDGRTVTVQPAGHEDAQPLRLGYASHALKLQGGQAQVVLVLPGGWQTSRQSAYSMATRCVEELHVFVDAQTQQAGPFRDRDPVEALGKRWTRDASKHAAARQLQRGDEFDGPGGRSLGDDLVAAPCEAREPTPVWAGELARERGLDDGLAIEL
jgi:ATP-dependent exoDNAse (exonuclease V) alpha subunit